MVAALAGKTVTFSILVRANATHTGSVSARIQTGTVADSLGGTWTTQVSATATPSTSGFTLMTCTYTVPSNVVALRVNFQQNALQASGAIVYWAQAQLEIGSVATTFSRAGGTIQGELAACQRYYYLAVSGTGQAISMGANYTASVLVAYVNFPVTMRIAPTLAASSGTDYYAFDRNGALDTFNSLNLVSPSKNGTELFNSTEISGTVGHGGIVLTNNASASLAFTAEL
jgi:hypothetical protein